MAARERLPSLPLRRYGIAAALAAAVFTLAYDNGAYALSTQATAGVVVWWAILLAVLVGVARVDRLRRAGAVVGTALAGLVLWTLASAFWSASAEASVAQFDRALLYLGVFLFVALVAGRGSAGAWADGLAAGISAIAFVALASRLFPSLFSHRGLLTFLTSAEARLSFPLGYWNGLGIFCALAVPLLLRSALTAPAPLARGLALAPVPAIASVIYLTSSRGAVVTLVVGTVVFLVASSRRPALIGAIAVAATGSAGAIAVLHSRRTLVDGPLLGAAARSEGRSAAWLVALACVGTAAVYGLVCRYWPGRLAPPAWLRRLSAIAAVVAAAAVVVAAHPARRFDAFKVPPTQYRLSKSGGYVQAHLLSANGTGRWQLWTAALDEWRTRPWTGRGAGSFEAWWAARGIRQAGFVKDAHSLYLQTLGELGVIGLALLLAVLVGGLASGVALLARTRNDSRVTPAALLSVVTAYAVAAAADWVWELAVITIVAIACLALLTGSATAAHVPAPGRGRQSSRRPARLAAPTLVVVISVLALAVEGDQVFGQSKIQASQAASARHDLGTAFADAVDARDLQPWAATPYLQLALVAEQQGKLATASQAISQATARASDDWRLWLVRTRIETERGVIASAVRALRQARRLNPTLPTGR